MEREFNVSMINIFKEIGEDINNFLKQNQVKILDLKNIIVEKREVINFFYSRI